MKKYIVKGLACLLALMLMTPMVWQNTAPTVAQAAKKEHKVELKKERKEASKQITKGKKDNKVKNNKKDQHVKTALNAKKKILNGIGQTYQLQIKNLPTGAAFQWYSTNNKVATVDSNGLVTSVNYGTAVIKCKLTDKRKGKSVLSCTLQVRGTQAAEKQTTAEVKITNKNMVHGEQYLPLGTTYDFNAEILLKDILGTIVWTISDPSVAVVNQDGVVTPIKEGTTVLTASAVNVSASGTAITASGSAITVSGAAIKVKNDQVRIKVVSGAAMEAAEVKSVDLVNDKTLVIKFSASMKADTFIDPITALLKSITITPIINSNGISAINPGDLKGVLTDDNKTLMITAANYFYGYYDVKLTNQIITAAGAPLKDYQNRTLLIYMK